jgi:type III secretion system FlhB-like substrate exporter
MSKHVVILCIINNGYSEVAMDAAKHCGARGGTVLHGRGTVSKEAEKFFNITVTPEKEIVMILASTDIKDAILKGLYDAVGSNTQAQGIAFALPVEDVIGIDKKQKTPATNN